MFMKNRSVVEESELTYAYGYIQACCFEREEKGLLSIWIEKLKRMKHWEVLELNTALEHWQNRGKECKNKVK